MIRETHLEVRRTARVAWLGEPMPHVRQVWIACHGFGQLAARFLRAFEPLAARHRLAVAPEALNRFYLDGRIGPHGPDSRVGATWMTREDRLTEIDDYVRYLDAVHDHVFESVDRGRARLLVLGFSQGVATVCRWAQRTRARIDELVLWGSPLPPELNPHPALFGDARLTLVAGARDPAFPAGERARHEARLREGGRAFVAMTFDGGHELDADTLRLIADR